MEDGSVDAVPSSWIIDNVCHWPPYPSQKLQNPLKKAEDVNTCWPTHTVNIFRNSTFGKYILLLFS